MSKSVDERLVKMEFDNRSFEKNAAQSIDTLDKIDEKLKFKNGKKGFEEVEKAAEKTNFSTLIKAADVVTSKLSALEVVGITALQNITNRAIYAGEQLVRSLSIDQITSGYSKYEQKTANVQTILNSTQKSMAEVDKYLEKLMWYSDETSYSFTEMLNSYATMLASGGESKNLLSVITGIGNAVSYAGKGASELNSVLRYSINQAYAKGYLLTQDYQTLQTMNVDNEKLRQSFIDAAKELKLLDENGRIIGDAAGTIVTAMNLPSTLSEKWLTKEVMEKAFGYWSEYSDAVYNATKVTKKFADTRDAMDALEDQYSQIAVAGFKAGQNAKTFGEAIDAIKDAVSTGWMNTFELIFGKIDEAIDLWGNLYDFLYPIFVEGSEKRNGWLSQVLDGNEELIQKSSFMEEYREIFLQDMSGRQLLHSGIFNILNGILDRALAIRDAWNNIFSGPTIEEGKRKLQSFFNFSEKFKMTEERGERITEIFEKLFQPIKKVTNFLKSIGTAVFALGKKSAEFIKYFSNTKEIKQFFDTFVGYLDAGSILEKATNLVKKFTESLNKLTDTQIAAYAKKAASELKKLQKQFENLHEKVGPFISNIGSFLKKAWTTGKKYVFDPVKDFLASVVQNKHPLKYFLDSIKNISISGSFAKLFGNTDFEDWKNNAKNAFDSVKESIDQFVKNVRAKASELSLRDILSSGLALVSGYSILKIVSAGSKIGNLADSARLLIDRVNDFAKKSIINQFSVNTRILVNSIFKMAVAIAGLGVLYSKYGNSLWSAVGMLSVMSLVLGGLIGGFAGLSKILTADNIKALTVMLDSVKNMARSMLILSVALAIASKNIPETFGQVFRILTEFAGMGGILLGMTFLLTKFSGKIGVSIIALIGIAGALAILGNAVGKIQNIQLTDTGEFLVKLSGIIVAIISILSLFHQTQDSSKKMIGLLATVGSMLGMVYILKELKTLPKDNMLVNFGVLISLFLGVVVLGKVLDIAIKSFDASWKDMLALSIGLIAVTGCVYTMVHMAKLIAESGINNTSLWSSVGIIAVIGIIAGGLVVALGFAQKLADENHNFLKIAASLYTIVGVMVAMGILVKAVEAVKLYENGAALGTVGGMSVLIAGLAVMMGWAGRLGKGKGIGYLLGLMSIITVISMIVIVLSKLQSPGLESAMSQIAGLMLMLSIVILSIGGAIRLAKGIVSATGATGATGNSSSGKLDPVVGMLTAVVVIGGLIAAILLLRDKINSWQDLIKIGAVIGGVLISVYAIVGALALLNKIKLNSGGILKVGLLAGMIVAIGGAIALIGWAMQIMKDVPLEGFGKKLLIITGVIFGLSLVVAGIAALTATGIGAIGVAAAILVLLSMSMAIYAFGQSVLTLSRIDLAGVGNGLLVIAPALGEVAMAGLKMIPGAIGVLAFAGMIGLLGLASGMAYRPIAKLLMVMNALAGFISVIGTAFQTEGSITDKLAAIGPALAESNAKSKQYAEELGLTIPETTAETMDEENFKIEESLASIPEMVSDQLIDVKEVVQEEVTDIIDIATETANKELEKQEKSGGLFGKAKDKVIGALSNAKSFATNKLFEQLGIPSEVLGLFSGNSDYSSLGNFGSTAFGFISEKLDNIGAGNSLSIQPIFDMDGIYGEFAGLFENGTIYEPIIRPTFDMSNANPILQKAQDIANSKNQTIFSSELFGIKDALSSLSNGINENNLRPTNITMNIYGSPGQDVDELAEIVMSKMESTYTKKVGVFK